MEKPLVGILMGSESDREVMEVCLQQCRELGIEAEMRVSSAHRNPQATRDYARQAHERGVQVLIAAAGMAAHLAGACASESILPVIGVPMSGGTLGGLDALLSTVQMPKGVPVATVAIGRAGARNAAILAAQILALNDPGLRQRLLDLRRSWGS
jgi:phosphoribosylaminoimidazole carboxylase PurE protein